MEEEVWKDIPGYKGNYQASSLGRIRSVDRYIDKSNGTSQFFKGKILSQTKNNGGYFYVSISPSSKRVNQLVAMAFLNHKPCGQKVVVDHINNNRLDNRVENLQLISQRKNASKDRYGYSSSYIGVFWHKSANKWMAQITIDMKANYLGLFEDEYDAHLAYQKALSEIED